MGFNSHKFYQKKILRKFKHDNCKLVSTPYDIYFELKKIKMKDVVLPNQSRLRS